uniref:Uncharacterized protein n=1 Tax=Anguilla anguilla TaxID=7936 RepID=A0A0E9XNH7_ANGAN
MGCVVAGTEGVECLWKFPLGCHGCGAGPSQSVKYFINEMIWKRKSTTQVVCGLDFILFFNMVHGYSFL